MSQFYLFIYCNCMSLACMPDTIHLNLVVLQVQGSVSRSNMFGFGSQPSSRHLGLVVCKARDSSIGLACMTNLIRLDLTISQVVSWVWHIY